MMEWFNKYVPGFICVGLKPHTFGSEGNTICCGLTSILWRSNIVEVKYIPQKLGQKEYNALGKTVSLMLRIGRSIFGSGKYFVLDCLFCAAKLITNI